MNDIYNRKDEEFTVIGEVSESFKFNDPLYKEGFKAGAASRGDEIAENNATYSALAHLAVNYLVERNQLREQVVMLRDALEVTHELYVNASSGYGFARPDNPHNFHCDIDCCSKEEIAAHSKACDDYAAGRKVSSDSWGIGTYCDEYTPAIKALADTEPKS